jgi:hypothetical protein
VVLFEAADDDGSPLIRNGSAAIRPCSSKLGRSRPSTTLFADPALARDRNYLTLLLRSTR